ncbi:MAG: OmpH family outer membrane protein, partial [Bacteroidota bacterium]|nr:OmpH family outer membrane protein [Bacteroidota bacterium]MEC8835446.1 OmpH family outer membrane protein [Bacteroidota bacterium]
MKVLRFILPLAMVFGFTLTSTAQTSKMGLVDQQAIVLEMPEYSAAQTKISEKQASKMQEIETLYAQYQTKAEEFQELAMSGTLSSGAQEAKETELYDLQTRIQMAEEMAQEYLVEYMDDLMEPISAKVDAAIQAVAQANGYTHVTDLSLFYVYPESDDITSKVKAHLGIQ